MKNFDILDKGDSLIPQMLLNGNLSIDDVLTLFYNHINEFSRENVLTFFFLFHTVNK